jgi:hypothetical protein
MSIRSIIRFACIAVAGIVMARGARAQESSPANRIGLSASIQGGQFDILVPIWTGRTFAIAPSVGLVWAEEGGLDIRLAVAPRFFFYRDTFAPYVGGKLGMLIASPDSGSATTDILIGGALGGEYFLDQHFSFGVESQLNLTLSDSKSLRFGNPGKKNLNTAAALFATIYF